MGNYRKLVLVSALLCACGTADGVAEYQLSDAGEPTADADPGLEPGRMGGQVAKGDGGVSDSGMGGSAGGAGGAVAAGGAGGMADPVCEYLKPSVEASEVEPGSKIALDGWVKFTVNSRCPVHGLIVMLGEYSPCPNINEEGETVGVEFVMPPGADEHYVAPQTPENTVGSVWIRNSSCGRDKPLARGESCIVKFAYPTDAPSDQLLACVSVREIPVPGRGSGGGAAVTVQRKPPQ